MSTVDDVVRPERSRPYPTTTSKLHYANAVAATESLIHFTFIKELNYRYVLKVLNTRHIYKPQS